MGVRRISPRGCFASVCLLLCYKHQWFLQLDRETSIICSKFWLKPIGLSLSARLLFNEPPTLFKRPWDQITMFIACLLCIITLKEPSLKLLSITLASLFVLSMASGVFDHCISMNFMVLCEHIFWAICFNDTENVMAYLAAHQVWQQRRAQTANVFRQCVRRWTTFY